MLALLQHILCSALPISDACIRSDHDFEPVFRYERCFAANAINGGICATRSWLELLDHQSQIVEVAAPLFEDDDRELLSTLAPHSLWSALPKALPTVCTHSNSNCQPLDLVVTLQRLVI